LDNWDLNDLFNLSVLKYKSAIDWGEVNFWDGSLFGAIKLNCLIVTLDGSIASMDTLN